MNPSPTSSVVRTVPETNRPSVAPKETLMFLTETQSRSLIPRRAGWLAAAAVLLLAPLGPLAPAAEAQQAIAERPNVRFSLENAEIYRARARYPEHSWVLAEGQADPILSERVPSTQRARGPEAGDPVLEVWSSQVIYQVGEPVELLARIEGAVPVRLTADVYDPAGNFVTSAVYRARPGQAVRSARLENLPTPERATPFLVQVEAVLQDGTTRRISSGFLLSNPGARLTGAFENAVVNGDAVVRAEVEVETAGRYHLKGVLANASGAPLGVAQTAVELEAGTHWMELPFYGLMFHDRGVTGPAVLESVVLTRTGGMPNAPGPVLERAYRLPPQDLDRLTSRPFQDPQRIDAAERLELEAALSVLLREEGSGAQQ